MTLLGFKGRNHPQQTAPSGQRSMFPEPPASDDVDDRATDPVIFAPWMDRFNFSIDVAASAENTKLSRFYDRATDGLEQSWAGERVWCNPPYSDIRPWIVKTWEEFMAPGPPELVVMLLPANRTEQGWWQELVEPHRDRPANSFASLRSEFLAGRLRFLRSGQLRPNPNERPPFGCVLLIWESVERRRKP